MADFAFVAIVLAFFTAAGGFVVLCDRIIGPPDQAATVMAAPARPADVPPAQAA